MSKANADNHGQQLDFALIDDQTPRLKVAKANALVEAQFQLTAKEHKLLLAAMAKIRKDQEELTEQVFMVKDIADLLSIPLSSAYSELRRISKGLMRKQVEVRNDVTGDWVLYQWVQKAYCVKGQFGLRFSDDLKPFLIGLVGRFTMYELGRVLKMRSNFSVRLYELLKQYEAFGTRTFSLDPKLTARESWDDFARVMGYDPSSYPRFSNVNQRIIKPALKEVRELTEFKDIQVKFVRWQRKTVAITLKFSSVDNLEDVEAHPILPEVRRLGVSMAACREVFLEYDDDRIISNLELVQEAHKAGRVENPAAYFLKAVKENFANPELPLEGEKTKGRRTASAPKRQHGDDDHPLYGDCATEQEFQKLLMAERERGEPFSSYNEFFQYTLIRTRISG